MCSQSRPSTRIGSLLTSAQKARKVTEKVMYQTVSGQSIRLEVSDYGERDRDVVYQFKRLEDGELYRDPDRFVENDEDSSWFGGYLLDDDTGA